MQNCLMKDMFVFVAREYVEDTQNGTGESASLSTWSKKSIAFKDHGKSLGKKAQLYKFQMYATCWFDPTQIIPSHLI